MCACVCSVHMHFKYVYVYTYVHIVTEARQVFACTDEIHHTF
jgi:hypothetical protein